MTHFISEDVLSSKTLDLTMRLNAITENVVMLILFFLMLLRGKSCEASVHQLKGTLKGLKGDLKVKSFKFWGAFLMIFSSGAIILAVYIIVFILEEFLFQRVASFVNMIMIIGMNFIILCYLWAASQIFAKVYEEIHQDILEKVNLLAPRFSSRTDSLQTPEAYDDDGEDLLSEMKPPTSENETSFTSAKSDRNSKTSLEYDLKMAHRKLLDLYKVRKLVQSYCGPVIVLLMLHMIFSAILGFFMLSFLALLPALSIVIVLAYICLAVTTVGAILEAPSIVREKVSFGFTNW